MEREDKKSIILAIGYIAIYSAYVEDELRKLIKIIKRFVHLESDIETLSLTRQAKSLLKTLNKRFQTVPTYSKSDKKEIIEILEYVIEYAAERNRILHSQLISKVDGKLIQENHKNKTITNITKKEVKKFQEFAEDLWELRMGLVTISFDRFYEPLLETTNDKD